MCFIPFIIVPQFLGILFHIFSSFFFSLYFREIPTNISSRPLILPLAMSNLSICPLKAFSTSFIVLCFLSFIFYSFSEFLCMSFICSYVLPAFFIKVFNLLIIVTLNSISNHSQICALSESVGIFRICFSLSFIMPGNFSVKVRHSILGTRLRSN